MRHAWSIGSPLSFCLLAGCAGCAVAPAAPPEGAPPAAPRALAGDDRLSPDETTTGAGRAMALRPELLYPVPDLLAWTAGGDLAIVDGRSGAVKEALVTLGLAGARDVAYDPATQRAWIAESDADGAPGEIASYPVLGRAALGPRAHEASLPGEARLLPSPLGVLSFEDAAGGRWRLLADGDPGASVAAPQPMSAWVTAGASGPTVRALAYGPASGELDAVATAAQPGHLALATTEPFAVDAGTLPPCARVVQAPLRGGALLVDVRGSFLSVRPAQVSAGVAASVPLGASGLRIEDAVGLRGGAVIAVLLSGTTEVVALAIDAQLHIAGTATLALPGRPTASTQLLAHDLAAQGQGRLVAATSAGVFSIQLLEDATGVHLGLAPGWDGTSLRGPIAPLGEPD